MTEGCGPAGAVLTGDDDVNGAVVALARAHRNAAATRLAALGLHPGQDFLLARLWAADPDGLRPGDLAHGMGVEPPTVARTLSRLEAAGFVVRTPSRTDRREVRVTLTDQGRALWPQLAAIWADLGRTTLAGLDSAEQTEFVRLLRHCTRTLTGEG